MIVLDTNVVSEMMRERPDEQVLAWVDSAGRLHTTAVTVAEMECGVARLSDGRRRDRFAATAAQAFADLTDLVLPFDDRAARRYARIVGERERAGRSITTVDAQIASICVSRGAALATRNTSDFDGTGVGLHDPWAE
ncbi:MAG: type II toxin-antitoxin system VapC family toxin [Phycicoccus sp.]